MSSSGGRGTGSTVGCLTFPFALDPLQIWWDLGRKPGCGDEKKCGGCRLGRNVRKVGPPVWGSRLPGICKFLGLTHAAPG